MEKPIQFTGKDMPKEISFGTWLRQRRRMLDLTQRALADQVGCAEITVRQMEADALKPSKGLAEILLERLGIPQFERPEWVAFARGTSGYPQKIESHLSQLDQKTNLPISLTSFVGREKDVERVKQSLAGHCLVSLIGVGGIGKTRLSQQVGRQVFEEYANGVWLVELASLNDPALIPQTVATVLGIQPQSNRPTIEILIQVLRAKTTLVILDNCEHLLDACAQLVDRLLKSCPHLKILATSREALGVSGESLFMVSPLALPDVQRIETPEKLGEYESLRLFKERAQLVQIDFALTTDNVSSVAQICSRLDGIPLAIELAAARANIMQLEEISKQLNECFSLLVSANRGTLQRHQTLQASMDWSWNLLTENEQTFMRQLSVFAGGWTLNSAQAVYNGVVVDLTSALVKKSLIIVKQETGHETRYDFHEIVRQYVREKLFSAGEEEHIRTRHLKYFLELSEHAEFGLKGATQIEWYARLNEEHDNIRGALEWDDQTDVEAGLYLSSRLQRPWVGIDFRVREGNYWLSKFLQIPESHAYPRARAKALYAHGWILDSLGQLDEACLVAKECLKLFRAIGDQQGEVDGLLLLAWELSNPTEKLVFMQQALALAQSLGDLRRQAEVLGHLGWLDPSNKFTYWERAIRLFRQVDDLLGLAISLYAMGFFLILNGNIDSAQKHLDEASMLYQQLNLKLARMNLNPAYGQIALMQGDFEKARAYLQEYATISAELGNRLEYLWSRVRLGYIALREGNTTDARSLFVETAQNFQNDGIVIGVVFALEGMAGFYIAVDKPAGAARLIGWADAMRENLTDTRPLIEQRDVDKIIVACVEKMGKANFSKAYEEGKKMSLDKAVAYALGENQLSFRSNTS